MKIIALAFLIGCLAQAVSGHCSDYQSYGQGLTGVTPLRISELMGEPDAYVDKRVKVVGLVSDVCPIRGCWVEILENQGVDRIRLKVQDDVIIFPVEAIGSEIIAEGILRRYELTLEESVRWLAHLAEEKGERFDESSAKGPISFYQIEGLGAKIALQK